MKKLIYGLIGLIVIAGIALAVILLRAGDIISYALEEYGPRYTGTSVKVADVELSRSEGRATIRGLTIGNPRGFDSPHAIRVDEATVILEINSLTGDEVIINNILVRSPDVNFEAGESGNNLQTIQANLERSTATETPAEEIPDEERTRIVIDEFVIENARATVVNNQYVKDDMSVTLGRIQRNNIGTRGNGVLPEEAAQAMIRPLINAVVREAASGALRRALQDPGAVIEGFESGGEGIVGGAKDKLKGLLGGNKDN